MSAVDAVPASLIRFKTPSIAVANRTTKNAERDIRATSVGKGGPRWSPMTDHTMRMARKWRKLGDNLGLVKT